MNELQVEGRVANLRATAALHGADRGRNDPDTSARKAHLFRGGCGCKVLQGVSQFPPRDAPAADAAELHRFLVCKPPATAP